MMHEESPIQFLFDVFKESGTSAAFAWENQSYSYDWLLGRIEHWTKTLQADGVKQGSVVAIEGDYSPEICSALIALIHLRAVSVPFASVTGTERDELMEVAEVGFRYRFEGVKLAAKEFPHRSIVNPLTAKFLETLAPGLVVFSSGSTGKQKGILHDFSRVLDKYRMRRRMLRTLTFLQLDHLGGLNTLFYVLSNGGTVISPKERVPRGICEAVQTYQIELLPVTPSFLNLLMVSEEYKKWDLSSLKIITYGTEVMPEATLKRVREVFPSLQLQQTYGLSELGVLRTKSRGDDSLWVKVGGEGFQTKVVDGILWIKAHSAMVGYLNAPQPFDADGWFDTQDQVEVDGDYLRILGRKSDIINVGGQKVFPSEVESVLSQMPNIRDVAVRGEKNFLMGNIVVATLNLMAPEEEESVKKRLREFCKGKLSPYKIPMKIEMVSQDLYSARFKRVRTAPKQDVTA